GERTLTLRAEAEGPPPREFAVQATVVPAYWRPNWRKAPEADVVPEVRGRRHYSQIDVDCDGIPGRFVLVVQEVKKGDDTRENMPRYYVMRDKVWNDLYARFAAAEPAKAGKTWEKGAEVVRGNETLDLGWESNRQLPALRMTVEQAHRFAIWLGGRLPSAR